MKEKHLCRDCNEKISDGEVPEIPDCPKCGEKMVQETLKPHETTTHTWKIALFSLFAIIVICATMIFQFRQKHRAPNGQTATIAALLEGALAMNKKTPLMIDKSTRLDEIMVHDKTITYKNTLVNPAAEERARNDVFKKDFKEFLTQKYCTDEKGRKGLVAGITYGQEYSGQDGTLLFKVDISLKDCHE